MGSTLPHVVLICGPSGSGKTTLMERLLPALKARGVRCATVKHHRGSVEVDRPGKDSWRHRRAGAEATFFVAGDEVTLFMDRPPALQPADLTSFCPAGIGLLLVEGFKELTGHPRIEIVRQGVERNLQCNEDVLCVVTDIAGFRAQCPVLSLDDAGAVADHLVRHLTSRCS